MANSSTKPTTIAAWVVGIVVILGVIGWLAGWFGASPPAQQTGQTPPATTQPAQPSTTQQPAAPATPAPAAPATPAPAPATPAPAPATGTTQQ